MRIGTDGAKRAGGQKTLKSPNRRPTIGFLCEQLLDEYSIGVWNGARDAAWEQGANLLCFSGGMFHDPRGFSAQANVLYDLVDEENVDGLLLWGAQLVHYTTPEELRVFCERYRHLPIVNAGLVLEGIPSLLVDNYQGMHDVVAHLIEVHEHRRIAYICGPGDTSEVWDRYRGYADALVEHGIPLDPALVVTGDDLKDESWQKGVRSGETAVCVLLDRRKLQPRVDLEALVGHDDGTSRGALRALQERGICVSADVAVASFDDVQDSRYLIPPLTTARQSFYDLGWRGIEMLLARLRGEEVPKRVVLPMKVVVRQSCGCMDSAVVAAGSVDERPGRVGSRKKLRAALKGKREKVVAEMVGEVGDSEEASRWVEQVLDGFMAEVEGESPGIFLRTLDEVLRQVTLAGDGSLIDAEQDVAAWQGAFSVLRQYLLPCLDDDTLPRAESLWQQARVLVGETARRAQAYQALQAEQRAQMLREIGAALITTFDVEELMSVLAERLPRLGIPRAYLSLYKDPQPYTYPQPAPEWSRLILAYDERGRVELEEDGRHFRSRQLAPQGILPDRQYSFVIVPLYFREHQIGFCLFEVGPREGTVYGMLGGDISSALQGALILRERERAEKALEQAYAEMEQQVVERTAQLQQETAERERLQQEVIEAQKRAIQELSTPIIPVLEGVIVMPLIGSIDTLRARDVTRSLLMGIRDHKAKVVILDITGVPIVDSGVAAYLNKTIQAARLKGARTIVTGISEAVAETIVDLGIDWSGIETLSNLQTGLRAALAGIGRRNNE
jgi:DNA-binding LacI/PurR family transcriptional regulator/anti-anti-sigma regulatory factor